MKLRKKLELIRKQSIPAHVPGPEQRPVYWQECAMLLKPLGLQLARTPAPVPAAQEGWAR